MATMRAAVMPFVGTPRDFLVKLVPRPIPKPGEVLIKVMAFGLNRAEMYTRKYALQVEQAYAETNTVQRNVSRYNFPEK